MKIYELIERFPLYNRHPLAVPPFRYTDNPNKTALGVESMKDHMTNEGWELMLALEAGGYAIAGKDCPINSVEVDQILRLTRPGTVVVQDKREWMGITADKSRDPSMRFRNLEALRNREDIFRLTIVKDAQHDTGFHTEAAEEIGCHAWICYYNPRIVSRLAPYLRPEHLVRTYHTVDRSLVPEYSENRKPRALLSGAMSRVYPLRLKIRSSLYQLPFVDHIRHPGYHRKGTNTPGFLQTLSQYKVSICTSSIYGYALRKIIESTACGCRVITDLPEDEVLPGIDGNLVRISPNISIPDLKDLVESLIFDYSPDLQRTYSDLALRYYDYRVEGVRLSREIESLRQSYPLRPERITL